jgi:ribosome recycling factor
MTELDNLLNKTIERLKQDLSRLRTGRANPAVLDGVQVDYYGTRTPLKQVANVTTPDARSLVIQPWEAPMCKNIEKAILEANLGLTPTSDGKIVRINLPPMTEERRGELVKQVKKTGEDAKVSVRQIRQDANNQLKKDKDSKTISEDEFKRRQDQVQKDTDKFVKLVDDVIHKKTDEIMTI